MPKRTTVALLMTAVFLTASLTALPAAADDEDWRLRVAGVWVDPSLSYNAIDGNDFKAGGDLGLSFAVERMISNRVGVEVGAFYSETEFDRGFRFLDGVSFRASYEADVTALTAALNIHLTPGRSTDLYIGPLFAYIDYGGVDYREETTRGQDLRVELRGSDDFAVGAQIGADVGFDESPWGLHFSARYLNSTLTTTFDGSFDNELEYEPLVMGVGFSYSF